MQKKFTNADEESVEWEIIVREPKLSSTPKLCLPTSHYLQIIIFLAIDFYYEENLGSIIQIRKHETHSY